MKNFTIVFLSFSMLLLTSCYITTTTHSAMWHGTDSITTNSNFKYVEYGIIGSASATYYPAKWKREQGTVREGLVADAKANMREQYQLKQNQAYANLSIDILKTTKESIAGSATSVEKIVLEVVVSADVIEYIND
jgi:hypothetical protein